MSAIKVGAHPLVVAVAMGLLGPGAVLDERRSDPRSEATFDLLEAEGLELEEIPSDEDFARVEDLWHEVRTTV